MAVARRLQQLRLLLLLLPFSVGLTGTYLFLYQYGGPVSIVWGWVLVSTANFLLGLVLAEICSAYPTSGGVYFWAHRLGGE
jgi:amino acid transporter